MNIIIIGAGIGGLTAGIGLKKYGHQVTIYERVEKILPVGAAISVWSNGVKCLNYLGLTEQVKKLGGIMDHLAYIDGKTQQTMTQFSLDPLIHEVGQRPYPVSRAELQYMLMDEFGMQDIKLGIALTHIQETEDHIVVQFSDGTEAKADLLIGADGTHSLAREYVLGHKVERRYAGYVNWNGLVDIDENIAPADQWTTYVGEGKRVSLMPIANNRFYFFFDVPLPLGLENDRKQYKALLKEYFADWCEPVQLLIERIDPERTNRVEIHDIEPFYKWVKGRCVLLGDAAHSTTPDIGQGGCMAMEDSIYLIRSLAINTNSLQDALTRYEKVRSERANDLVLRARKRCDITHMKDPEITQAWYEELHQEDGQHIMKGIISNIIGNPLD
ncbi:FAD-dependent urate hydroxylase HpxO [Acinetobacter qingfengensis]|uniref:FAD-dependent urate hydroxylase n=1 Tax=Acinetobacter qingfengensis TaxID=1262585 RepID=A0A1E7R912_9GAMM|nr:FAD-dependent urate hydroxylase HpxO [Acinetobacter qingfengensis]KAA8735404.1 FAD-dependent urate hydroxylase HpxO [Acinetobacter qingfengensis]OEY95762.1 monooxygenase [Acinetobacter qingfengensis]